MTIRKIIRKFLTSIEMDCRGALWRLRQPLGLQERVPGNERLSVVLLSYRRMNNLPSIVDSLLLCEFVQEIILSNNNPEVRMEEFIRVRDPRLRIINQPARCFPSKRYELARELPAKLFLSIDDDLFLTPGQIKKLFISLIANPAVPHGAGGQNFAVDGEKIISFQFVSGVAQETDVILWAYAFTREHLLKYFSLLDQLQIAHTDLKASEDVVISFAGNGRARCVGLGRMLSCTNSDDREIATWMQDGFSEHRNQLFLQCRNAVAAGSEM
jgi:hypothetical protein